MTVSDNGNNYYILYIYIFNNVIIIINTNFINQVKK